MAGAWCSPWSSAATSGPSIKFPVAAHDRIAIASYPFREFIAGPDHKAGNPVIALKDFAAHAIEKFGVHRIELWSSHFPSTDAKYLDQFRAAVTTARSAVVNIAVDGDACPYTADAAERERAIAFSKHWIDVAVAIGSPSVRTSIPADKGHATPDMERLAASVRKVADYGAAKDVVVHLENDNPLSEDPFLLEQLVEKVCAPWLRLLPDFCNTLAAHDADYAYRGIDTMFAHAYGICHVKDSEVSEKAEAVHVDLPRTFGILKKHKYKGYCSMEYDMPGDPYPATAELVRKTVEFLS